MDMKTKAVRDFLRNIWFETRTVLNDDDHKKDLMTSVKGYFHNFIFHIEFNCGCLHVRNILCFLRHVREFIQWPLVTNYHRTKGKGLYFYLFRSCIHSMNFMWYLFACFGIAYCLHSVESAYKLRLQKTILTITMQSC